jgi:chaperonin GroES
MKTKNNNITEIDITKLQLLGDNVLVLAVEKTECFESGDEYDEKPEYGIVVSVGEGAFDERGERIPMVVKKGDIVLFNKYSVYKHRQKNKDYYIVREFDISGYARQK